MPLLSNLAPVHLSEQRIGRSIAVPKFTSPRARSLPACLVAMQARAFTTKRPRVHNNLSAGQRSRPAVQVKAFGNGGSISPPYNVLITGSTKGIGLALARKHLDAGVCYRARSHVLPTAIACWSDGESSYQGHGRSNAYKASLSFSRACARAGAHGVNAGMLGCNTVERLKGAIHCASVRVAGRASGHRCPCAA